MRTAVWGAERRLFTITFNHRGLAIVHFNTLLAIVHFATSRRLKNLHLTAQLTKVGQQLQLFV